METEFDPEALSFPVDPIPGAIIMILRECRVQELGWLSYEKKRQIFTVRAFITDNPDVNYSLPDAVKRPSSASIELQQEVITLFNHHGGDKAVFFEMVRGTSGLLSHIQVQVSATRPELALGYARAEINRLLDRFTASAKHPHPFSIQRLELLSPKDSEVIAYQLMIPFSGITRIGQIPGFFPAGLFAGHHAIFREAINNPSPFYRLLLAYRAHEGISFLRGRVAKAREHYKIGEPMPKKTRLDNGELARLQLSEEVRNLKQIDQLFSHFGYLRNGIAHFLLKPTDSGEGHIYLSSVSVNTYAIASALLLKYIRIESRQLEDYYVKFVRPQIDRGRLIYPMAEYRDRFIIFSPDIETDLYEDEV